MMIINDIFTLGLSCSCPYFTLFLLVNSISPLELQQAFRTTTKWVNPTWMMETQMPGDCIQIDMNQILTICKWNSPAIWENPQAKKLKSSRYRHEWSAIMTCILNRLMDSILFLNDTGAGNYINFPNMSNT